MILFGTRLRETPRRSKKLSNTTLVNRLSSAVHTQRSTYAWSWSWNIHTHHHPSMSIKKGGKSSTTHNRLWLWVTSRGGAKAIAISSSGSGPVPANLTAIHCTGHRATAGSRFRSISGAKIRTILREKTGTENNETQPIATVAVFWVFSVLATIFFLASSCHPPSPSLEQC